MKTTYHAIRVDMENNAEDFWDDLREHLPHVAKALEQDDCAIVDYSLYMCLDSLGAFNGEPSPLIDCGSEGDQWDDVTAQRHQVLTT